MLWKLCSFVDSFHRSIYDFLNYFDKVYRYVSIGMIFVVDCVQLRPRHAHTDTLIQTHYCILVAINTAFHPTNQPAFSLTSTPLTRTSTKRVSLRGGALCWGHTGTPADEVKRSGPQSSWQHSPWTSMPRLAFTPRRSSPSAPSS